jgi:KDO2-lipid IV(A) lauroyltransferase
MRDGLYIVVFKTFQFIVRLFPPALLRFLITYIALLACFVDKRHVRIAKVNLDLAFEEQKSDEEKYAIIKKCYQNLLFSLTDFIKNQGISKEKLLNKVTFHNDHILQDALDKNQKIILVTAHYGNWELLPLSLAAKFGPLTGVGRNLDSTAMDMILLQNREQFNIEMLDKKGAMKDMIRAVKNGRMLGLLVDQNTSEKEGLLIDFFGKKARHTPSAAILARRFETSVIPAFITTEDHLHYHITFYEPILTPKTEDKDRDIQQSVQAQAAITEKVIRAKPEEWFWLHQRWKNQYEHLYA